MSDTYRNPPERSGGGCKDGGYHDYVKIDTEYGYGEPGDEFTPATQGRGWYRTYKCSKCGDITEKDGRY